MTVSATSALVQQAASGTGLPAAVVAAQINEESGGNASALSPAGAEGEFQFLPSTYTGLGFPAGTEDDPAEEVLAYIKYMNQLLSWAGGDVAKALAAYNAGEGNWQAGQGYANTILSNAGQPATLTSATTGGTAGTGSAGLPAGLLSNAGNLVHAAAVLLDRAFAMFAPGQSWRIVFGISAVVLSLLSYRALGGSIPIGGAGLG